MTVFRVEYLPVDIQFESSRCVYQIREYIINRETKDYVWATCLDSRVATERRLSNKFSKKEFYRFGAFCERDEAIHKIRVLLTNNVQIKYESYLQAKAELEIFYKEYNIQKPVPDNYINKDIWNKQMNRRNHEVV